MPGSDHSPDVPATVSGHRHRIPLTVGCTLLLVLTLLARNVAACECSSGGPACSDFFQADAVFVGTVQSMADVAGTPESPAPRRVVSFAMESALRGVQGATADVVTGTSSADCGYPFVVGERYLVYASRTSDGKALQSSICSRTGLLSGAAEDIQYIDQLATYSVSSRVFGAITHWERDLTTGQPQRYGPVPSVHVMLRGPSGARDALTDEQGRYEFVDVPPGSYEVRIAPPAIFSAKGLESTVDVRDPRACAASDFGVRYDGRVSGVILDADGQPAPGITVEAMAAANLDSPDRVETLRATTDAGGYFEFSELSPGRYVLGVGLVRAIESDVMYPRTLHPGTPDHHAATVIEVGEGTRHQLDSFRLPTGRPRRQLTGQVVWADGKPVTEAVVALVEGTAPFRQVSAAIKTDAEGRFTFVTHEGLSYTARASYAIPAAPKPLQVRTKVGPFVASDALPPLQLVLEPPVAHRDPAIRSQP